MNIKDAAAAVNLYSPKFFNRIAFDLEFSEEFDEYSDACEVLANHAVRFFDETPVDPQWIMEVIPPPQESSEIDGRTADDVYELAGYDVPISGSLIGQRASLAWLNYGDDARFEFYVDGECHKWRGITRGQFRAQAFAVGIQLAEDL